MPGAARQGLMASVSNVWGQTSPKHSASDLFEAGVRWARFKCRQQRQAVEHIAVRVCEVCPQSDRAGPPQRWQRQPADASVAIAAQSLSDGRPDAGMSRPYSGALWVWVNLGECTSLPCTKDMDNALAQCRAAHLGWLQRTAASASKHPGLQSHMRLSGHWCTYTTEREAAPHHHGCLQAP